MKPERLLAIFSLIVVIIVLILYLTSSEESLLEPENTGPPEVSDQAPAATDNGQPAPGLAAPPKAAGRVGGESLAVALPPSLQGVAAPSGWQQVSQGQLQASPVLRQLFDHYLAALGEISLADIQRLIEAELAQLPDGARQQAKQILGDYLAYKAALTGIAEVPVGQSLDPMQMRNHLKRLRALRRDTLGQPVSEAFFATQEAYEDFALARLSQRQNSPAVTPDGEALAQLEAQLPEPIRQARERTRTFTDYRESLQALRASGGDARAVRQLREERFGQEGAERLAALDHRRQDWERRFTRYAEARQALEEAGLADIERDAAVARLRREFFSEQEIARVQALDQAGLSPAGL